MVVKQTGAGSRLATGAEKAVAVQVLLVAALIAFEIFNFDTTRFALTDFLGSARFLGLSWAAILAFAFCAIDFAGLVRLFTPEVGQAEPRAVWYLTGAWLLGATLNGVMTWWAVTLTLLTHSFGNEVLGRAALLHAVPVFVAVLVWLTRILFIGSLAAAGDQWQAQRARATRRPGMGTAPRPAWGGRRPAGSPTAWAAAPRHAAGGSSAAMGRRGRAAPPSESPPRAQRRK